MKRMPRSPKDRLFGRRSLVTSTIQGLVAFGAVIGVYAAALSLGESVAQARTLAFITLIVSNLSLILTNRSWQRGVLASFAVRNPALLWVIGGALGFLALVVYVPALQRLFHFAIMHPLDLAIAFAAGLFSIAWFEVMKLIARRRRPPAVAG
jgi:Ca2+-transporting ATPase